jgi:hypothetical protein
MAMLLLLLCGLGTLPEVERGECEFQPTAEEARVPAEFRLPPSRFAYSLSPVLETPRFSVSRLEFASPIVSPDPENNIVPAEYFLPRPLQSKSAAGNADQPEQEPGQRPAVVVLHILGADFALSRFMAARLADHGVAALFVKLPYYGERSPTTVDGASTMRRFLSDDVATSVLSMRQGVCDVRRAAAWLAGRPEVDPTRIGVTGISLGGIVASLTVAVDPAITEGAFLMAGGDLAKVLWQMPEAAATRRAWEESGRNFADLKALTDPYDPLSYASRLTTKRTLFFGSKVDEVIPPACTIALWEKAGRPPIHWFDCGHYSAVGFLLPAIRQTAEFFADGPRPGQADEADRHNKVRARGRVDVNAEAEREVNSPGQAAPSGRSG